MKEGIGIGMCKRNEVWPDEDGGDVCRPGFAGWRLGLGSFRLYSNWATWRLILGFPGYVLEFALNNWNRSLCYSKAYNSIPLLECTIVTIGW